MQPDFSRGGKMCGLGCRGSTRLGKMGLRIASARPLRQSRCAPCVHRSSEGSRRAASLSLLFACFRWNHTCADVKHYNNRIPVTKQILDVMCMFFLCSILWLVLSLIWYCVWSFASQIYVLKSSKFRRQPGRSSIVGWTPALVLRWVKLSSTLVFAKYFRKT